MQPSEGLFVKVSQAIMQGRRKVRKSGGLVLLGRENVPPLVEIGLTDLPKTGGAEAPQAPSLRQPCSPHGKYLF